LAPDMGVLIAGRVVQGLGSVNQSRPHFRDETCSAARKVTRLPTPLQVCWDGHDGQCHHLRLLFRKRSRSLYRFHVASARSGKRHWAPCRWCLNREGQVSWAPKVQVLCPQTLTICHCSSWRWCFWINCESDAWEASCLACSNTILMVVIWCQCQ
jgi:hypothetical protein